ncbi:MAG: UbiA prenyltransferase family protein [Cyclobacteriaceae bacterium]
MKILAASLKNKDYLQNYIKIARPDHWFKNIFMLPGIAFSLIYYDISLININFLMLISGIISTCLIASANYVINEWLDAPFDKYHPIKKNRPSVVSDLNRNLVYFEYFLLATTGLLIAYFINIPFFVLSIGLLVSGIIYNVEPIRTKDRAYLDVLSESLNNPLRLMLGWFLISPVNINFTDLSWVIIPPSSMLVSYWMGGAFLMAAKRLSEYKYINDHDTATLYRKSFQSYNEQKLLLSSFFYALSSSFFLGIFLIKNKIELLLSFPLFAGLFTWYLYIAYKKDSSAQRPEKLFNERKFILYIFFLVIFISILAFTNIEPLQWFLNETF